MEYKPSASKDVEEVKVSLALSSPKYEVKAISKNFKCAILYRYETGSEELSLVDFGTGSTATLKANAVGKALNVTIANAV